MTPETNVATRRILLVEDHDLSIRHALAALKGATDEIRTACSAGEAIALAVAWMPGIILIDLQLDGREGIEVIREIRQAWPATRPHPKIVVLTGDSSRLDPADSQKLEIDHVLIKPVSGPRLRDAIGADGHGVVNEKHDMSTRAELRELFQEELKRRLPDLDRYVARLERDRISGILHQLIASAAMTGQSRFESRLRQLDAKCRKGATNDEIASCYHAVLQSARRWNLRGPRHS